MSPWVFSHPFNPKNPWKHEGFKSFMRYGWTNCYKDFLATWVPTNHKNPLFKDWGNVGSHKPCVFLNASKSDTFPPISFGSFCFRHFAVPKSPTFVVVVFEITRDFFWCATSRPGFVILVKRFPKSAFLSNTKKMYQKSKGARLQKKSEQIFQNHENSSWKKTKTPTCPNTQCMLHLPISHRNDPFMQITVARKRKCLLQTISLGIHIKFLGCSN